VRESLQENLEDRQAQLKADSSNKQAVKNNCPTDEKRPTDKAIVDKSTDQNLLFLVSSLTKISYFSSFG
jgi:hypothetical protein